MLPDILPKSGFLMPKQFYLRFLTNKKMQGFWLYENDPRQCFCTTVSKVLSQQSVFLKVSMLMNIWPITNYAFSAYVFLFTCFQCKKLKIFCELIIFCLNTPRNKQCQLLQSKCNVMFSLNIVKLFLSARIVLSKAKYIS